MSVAEVAAVTSGEIRLPADGPAGAEGVAVTGVVIDSREVRPGDLFVAFDGEHVDGHDFVEQAGRSGAVAALVSRPVPGAPVPTIGVPDVTVALGQLARQVVRRCPDLRVVAVTGSAGKTTTKDLLVQILPLLGPTVAPVGSFNNDLGVPLTVCRCDEHTRLLVLEMGARGPGHLDRLCRIACPSIGVVLNVGSAHLGEFGSREGIAAAKAEVAVAARDVAVLNADDPLVAAMAQQVTGRVVTFGTSEGATVRASDVRIDDEGRASFQLDAPQAPDPARVSLQLVGGHHVSNALAAAAVALECGLDLPRTAHALSTAVPRSRWRMEVRETADGITVINDAYNANPESMRAALTTLVGRGRASGRRTWAVLGEMAELGDASAREHDALGRLAVRLDVSRLLVVGDAAGPIHAGALLEGSWGDESLHVDDIEEAIDVLREQARPGDIVLVKGSRVAGLERVAAALVGEGS